MTSRDQILNKIESFQSTEKLELDFDFELKDAVSEFVENAKLAGATVYALQANVLNEKLNEHIKDKPDHFVYESKLGVGENGALWCHEMDQNSREQLFMTNDLVIKIKASNLVYNMHQAYESLSLDSREFGTFIAGPSKTADIEQSLVIGAHGAMSLTIFVELD